MLKLSNIVSSMLIATIGMGFISGCVPKQVKVDGVVNKRSQKLLVRLSTNVAKEKAVQEYLVLKLDNQGASTGVVSLENKGGKPLKIISITSKGKTSDLFDRTTECDNTVIQPGEKCTMDVSFIGKKAGYFQQILKVESNDKRNKTTLIKINASAADITNARIEPRSTPKKYSPNHKLSFNVLNRSQYVEVSQVGDKKLNIKKIKLTGKNSESFTFSTTCPKVLDISSKCGITVNYDPTKKVGLSKAEIRIVSDGAIAPTNKIELSGRTEAYSVDIVEYKVSLNIKEFMDDYFSTNTKYFYRTMFQSNSDDELEKQIDKQLQVFFKNNSLNKAYKASDANRIINIYPRIVIEDLVDENNHVIGMTINMGVNGILVTKSTYNTAGTDCKGECKMAQDQNTSSTSFVAMSTEKEFVDKEDFSYFLKLKVTNYEDRNLALNRVAEIMAQKLFNVLGMNNDKANR